MFNITIFSKDRAAQLELLLRSIKEFWQGYDQFTFNILYTASTEKLQEGYNLCMTIHKEFNYIRETDFKANLLSVFDENKKYTMFFVDDNVFKTDFTMDCDTFKEFETNDSILTLSLRMAPYMTYCYTHKKSYPLPTFIDGNKNNWTTSQGEWNYPFSVDGNIFRTKDIAYLIKGLSYRKPNTFEGALTTGATRHRSKYLMMCFPDSIVMNIPANKVQTENENHAGLAHDYSADSLNELFLNGKRISLDNIIGHRNNSPHEEMELHFVEE